MSAATVIEMVRSGVQPVRMEVERAERCFSQEKAADLFPCFTFMSIASEYMWAVLDDMLNKGYERGKVVTSLNKAKETISGSLELFRSVGPKLAANGLSVAEQEQRVAAVLAKINRLSAWLESSKNAADLRELAKQESQPAEGRYENLDAILARLQSGGEL